MNKQKTAVVEMIACATLWSIAGVMMKFIPWNGFVIAGWRSLLAGITIAVCMIIGKHKFIFDKEVFASGILTGLVYICFVVANKTTTAANAIVLQFTAPIFIVIFSAVFLKFMPSRDDIWVVILTLIGIALFFFDQLKPGYILGNCIAILSGIFMAVMYIVLGNLDGDKRFCAILVGQAFTFLVGIPFTVINPPVLEVRPIMFVIILGVLQLGISYYLYARASRYCSALTCSLLGVIEPLLNPVWVMIFDGETPGVFALVGSVIVIISITAWNVKKAKMPMATA